MKSDEIMSHEERLVFLRERLEFRHKMFIEWLFVDKTIIEDPRAFLKRTKEIEKEVLELNKDTSVSDGEVAG